MSDLKEKVTDMKRIKNKMLSPQFSIIIVCIFTSIYVVRIENKLNLLLILCTIFICVLCFIRYIKEKMISLILFILEIICIIFFSILYLFFYQEFINSNEINVLFMLFSLIFLIPMFIEIGLQNK